MSPVPFSFCCCIASTLGTTSLVPGATLHFLLCLSDFLPDNGRGLVEPSCSSWQGFLSVTVALVGIQRVIFPYWMRGLSSSAVLLGRPGWISPYMSGIVVVNCGGWGELLFFEQRGRKCCLLMFGGWLSVSLANASTPWLFGVVVGRWRGHRPLIMPTPAEHCLGDPLVWMVPPRYNIIIVMRQ